MPRAAGCPPAARRPARTTERDGKWLQDRIVRRLLLPGRRAVRTRRAAAPGGTGCVADPVCGVRRRRREAPLALEGRRALPAPARIAHRSDARASCIPRDSHPTQANLKSEEKPRLRFCTASKKLPQKRPPVRRSFFLFGGTQWFYWYRIKSRDFLFREFQWFIIEPNRYKTAAGSPKTRVDPPYGVFLFSPSRLRRRTEK